MKVRSSGMPVYLRSLEAEDSARLASIANEYDIACDIFNLGVFPYPYSKDDASTFIRQALEKEVSGNEYNFVVCDIDGKIVGACALWIKVLKLTGEIGYWIGKEYRGRGYATSAVKLIMWLGFNRKELQRVYAEAYSDNIASNSVLRKAGFIKEGIKRSSGYTTRYLSEFKEFMEMAKDNSEFDYRKAAKQLNIPEKTSESWNRRFVTHEGNWFDVEAGDIPKNDVMFSMLKEEYESLPEMQVDVEE